MNLNVTRFSTFSTLALASWLAPATVASPQGTIGPCGTNQVELNTGYEHVSSTVLNIGDSDGSWTVVLDPDFGTLEPRPATVIQKNGAWKDPLPGSQWISSYASATNDLNGTYIFETCFCLEEGFTNATFLAEYRADDQATLFLNGFEISASPISSFSTALPTRAAVTNQDRFLTGMNCVRVKVNNTHNVAMGLNLRGTVTAGGAGLIDTPCCDSLGSIQGFVWKDTNGNGVHDTGELPFVDRQINLSNGATEDTDSNGYYYFLDVVPGNYTVTQEFELGWISTFPSGGSHTVVVAAGQAVNKKDFGNVQAVLSTTPYCEVNPNSLGITSHLGASGSSNVSLNSLTLIANNVPPGQFGLFYYGANQISVPFGNGFRCVGGETFRLGVKAANAFGVLEQAVDVTSPVHPNGTITSGSTWNFQCWYRDPAGGGAGFNLSDGLQVDFQP